MNDYSTYIAKVAAAICIWIGATSDGHAEPSVLSTYEFHQLTSFAPYGVNYENGSFPKSNNHKIVFNRPNPAEGQARACDVMVIGLSGAYPQTVDRWEDVWAVEVDISEEGSGPVVSSNGWAARMVQVAPTTNEAIGSPSQLIALSSPEIRQIRSRNVPYFLLGRDGGRVDEPGTAKAGVNRGGGPTGPVQLVIGSDRVAADIGVSPNEIVAFAEFDVGAVWSTEGPRVVFTAVVDARPSGQPDKTGLWFFSWDERNAQLTQVQAGPGDYQDVTISYDGTKIFYREGQKIWMLDWPGGGEKKLVADGLGYHRPITGADGSWVLIGDSGVLVTPEDGGKMALFATGPYKENFGFDMGLSGEYVSMITRREGIAAQVGVMRRNPPPEEILPTTPRILGYSLQPPGMISDSDGAPSIIRARIEPAERISSVPWVLLTGIVVDNLSGLWDQFRADAGFVAGDHVFDGFASVYQNKHIPTRVLRIHADALDEEQQMHSFAMEVGSLPIGPPPAPDPQGKLDADGNAATDALTDGLLIMRYLFGFKGEALTAGALAPDALRHGAALEAYLAENRQLHDIDGNSRTDAATDGLLILRYVFGFRGDSLIKDAVADNATRRNAAQIEPYLRGLFPN